MASSADLLAELRDIRLPELGERALVADLLAAFALGLLLAILIALLARLFTRRKPTRRRLALKALAEARRLPPDERLLAQARLLRDVAAQLDGGAGEAEAKGHWIQSLDRRFGTTIFTSGPSGAPGLAAGLGEALYRPRAANDSGPGVDPDRLDAELVRLLKKLKG